MAHRTLLLSKADVEKCITMDEVIETVEEVFRAHGEHQVVLPCKITLNLASFGVEAWSNAMPAYVHPLKASGIKWAGGYLNNPTKYGLSYIMATIILQDPEKGLPLAIMDGIHITNLRTGAAGAMTAKYVARQDSTKVAIVGAGVQGRTTLWALSRLFNIASTKVVDVVFDSSARFAEEMSESLNVPVSAARIPEEAVVGADIVVTVTPANEPIVKNAWLKKGVTAISMGSYQEFDEEFTLSADRIVVDNWDQCSHRGELLPLVDKGLITKDNIACEIGEIVAGGAVGRESMDQRILAVPIGLGTHDIAVASKVYQRALEQGLGEYFEFV